MIRASDAPLPHKGKTDAGAPALHLSWQDAVFLSLCIFGAALFVVLLGKDTSWDFRNYHWYNPYALLNDRLLLDVAVAHHASYYNPLIDIPFYLLAKNTTSWFALAVLGAVQGLNAVPLYVMARQSLRLPERRLGAMLLTILGITGGLSLSLLGTSYYDNVLSIFWLSSLCLLVLYRHDLRQGPLINCAVISFIAGALAGSAMGLKLPAAPFAFAFGVSVLLMGGAWSVSLVRIAAGAVGGVFGFLLCAGFWMETMHAFSGNPLFPYFNEIFESPLALASSYRDTRFLPEGFWAALLLPLHFTLNWSVSDDLPFRDMRILCAYIGMGIAAICFALRRRADEPFVSPSAMRVLFIFAISGYLAWISIFAIYRYIVGLEMLAPLLTCAAVGLLPLDRRRRLIILGTAFLCMLIYTRSDFMERAPLGDPYVQANMPSFAQPKKTLILMTGTTPMGYLAPLIPPTIPLLRIDGWMLQPKDGTRLTQAMRKQVEAMQRKRGEIFVLADGNDMGRARDALAEYNLAIRWLDCVVFESNMTGVYRLCPLSAKPPKGPLK